MQHIRLWCGKYLFCLIKRWNSEEVEYFRMYSNPIYCLKRDLFTRFQLAFFLSGYYWLICAHLGIWKLMNMIYCYWVKLTDMQNESSFIKDPFYLREASWNCTLSCSKSLLETDVRIWEQVSSFFQMCWGNHVSQLLVGPFIFVGTAQPARLRNSFFNNQFTEAFWSSGGDHVR